MGGGVKASQTRFSVVRREKISNKAIERTGKELGVDMSKDSKTFIKVVNEKDWTKLGVTHDQAAAFYRKETDTLYIRRKFFAKRGLEIEIHERFHARSGDRVYRSNISRILEEGTVDWLTDYTLENSFKTKARKFATPTGTGYITETDIVSNIMTIVGRKRYLQIWKKGFAHKSNPLADLQIELNNKGYTKLGKIVSDHNYYSGLSNDAEYKIDRHHISREIKKEIEDNKGKNWDPHQHADIITYQKQVGTYTQKQRDARLKLLGIKE